MTQRTPHLDISKYDEHLSLVTQEVIVRGQLQIISSLELGRLLSVGQEAASDLGTLFEPQNHFSTESTWCSKTEQNWSFRSHQSASFMNTNSFFCWWTCTSGCCHLHDSLYEWIISTTPLTFIPLIHDRGTYRAMTYLGIKHDSYMLTTAGGQGLSQAA